MLSGLELKAYSLEWGNPSFAREIKGRPLAGTIRTMTKNTG